LTHLSQQPKPNNIMPATIKIGSTLSISVPGTDIKQLFKDVSFWTNDFPKKCGRCESENLAPAHRNVKGFDYYSAKCGACGGEYAFGQAKEGGHLFPKREWKPPYHGTQEQAASTDEADDIPMGDDQQY
jgi:hypothetical protein